MPQTLVIPCCGPLRDGDHSFKPRSSSGRTQVENWREGISVITDFVKRRAE